MNIKHELKVGLFIIGSIFILIFVILWLHKFDMSSYIYIDARFKDTGALSIGSSVLYRGVKAGIVDNIVISPDEEYALVKIRITNKDINVYEGSTASVIDKGFTGTKVLSINPPKTLKGKRKLVNGDVIEGLNAFNIEQIQKLLTELAEEGKIDDMINDTHDLVRTSKNLTTKMGKLIDKTNEYMTDENEEKFNEFVQKTTRMASALDRTSNKLDKILDNKKLGKDLTESIASTGEAMKELKNVVEKSDKIVNNIDKTINNIDETVNKFDDTINNDELHGSLKNSLSKVSDVMGDIRNITGDKGLQENLKETIKNSNNSISRLNCFSTELSNTLSKRFLIPRMLLGRPGKNLTKCTTPKALTEEKKDE